MHKPRDWFYIILPLFMTWGVDRITKMWAEHLHSIKFYGYLGFALHHNHGAMLGLFSSLPAVLRIVSFSTGGAFLLFLFIVIQYLLPLKSMSLRIGMSILIGGILGNVTDRILAGYVTDFIVIGSQTRSSPAFNLADALQWVGYFLIAWALIREGEILWPESETRKVKWVNFKFQVRYSLILVSVGLGFSIISGVYSYTFMRVTIMDLIGNNPRLLEQYLVPFVVNFLFVSGAFSVILFLTGRVISQRMAGPLFAFERYVDELIKGNPKKLRLRSNDEFKQLENIARKISEELFCIPNEANYEDHEPHHLENLPVGNIQQASENPSSKAS